MATLPRPQDGTVHLVYGILEQPFSSLEAINTSGLRTGLQRVQLLKPNISIPALPADVRTMEVRAPDVLIPGQETTYWCYMTELPPDFPRHHIVMVRGGGGGGGGAAAAWGPAEPSLSLELSEVLVEPGVLNPGHLIFLKPQVWSDPSHPSSQGLAPQLPAWTKATDTEFCLFPWDWNGRLSVRPRLPSFKSSLTQSAIALSTSQWVGRCAGGVHCPRPGVPSTPQYEPIVTEGNEALVHHMEVFQCAAGFQSFPHFSGPCDSKMKPERLNYCRHVLAAWALGAKVRHPPHWCPHFPERPHDGGSAGCCHPQVPKACARPHPVLGAAGLFPEAPELCALWY